MDTSDQHDTSGHEQAKQQSATAPAAQKRAFYRGELRTTLLIGLCIGAALYLLLHLAGKLGSMGQEGGNVAQIWSFIIAILELGASITAIVLSLIPKKRARKIAGLSSKERRAEFAKHRPRLLVIGIAATLLAFCLPPVVNKWAFRHMSKENITTRVQLTHNTALSDGSTAFAVLPKTKHTKLLLSLRLISQQTTGSCVAPARMKVTISYNASDGQTLYDVRSGDQQTITLGDMSQPAKLTIDLKNDPYCTVRLAVGSAIYQN